MLVQYILQIPSEGSSVPLTGSFEVPDMDASNVFTLDCLRKSFPFEGNFHFRVRVVPPGSKAGEFAWFDLSRGQDKVPFVRAGNSESIATIKALPLFGLNGELFPLEEEEENAFNLTESQFITWQQKKCEDMAKHTGTRTVPFSLTNYPLSTPQQSKSGIASIGSSASGIASALWSGISNVVGVGSASESGNSASHGFSGGSSSNKRMPANLKSEESNSYRYDDPVDDGAGEFWSNQSKSSDPHWNRQEYDADEDSDINYGYNHRKGDSREDQLAAAASAAKDSTVAALSAAGSLLKGFARKAVTAANKAANIASEKIG